jgi:hypothetical protein
VHQVLCDGLGLSFGLGLTSSVATCFVGFAFLLLSLPLLLRYLVIIFRLHLRAAAFAAVG